MFLDEDRDEYEEIIHEALFKLEDIMECFHHGQLNKGMLRLGMLYMYMHEKHKEYGEK